ncbi:MAG: hypothetical protein V3U03_15345 [Myxococcota bacterium]
MSLRANPIHPAFAALAVFALAGCAGTRTAAGDGATPAASPGNGVVSTSPAPSPAAAPPSPPRAGAAPSTSTHATGRPGRILIYSMITGHVPLRASGATGGVLGRPPHESEEARAAALEAEIEAELRKQEDLRGRTAAEQARAKAANPQAHSALLEERAKPLIAPEPPADRQLPRDIYREERITIAPGTWGNPEELDVVSRTLDADGDGVPEQVRYYAPGSDVILRKVEDRNFDGKMDTWTSYRGGAVVERVADTNADGRPDAWSRYGTKRMKDRTIDRDYDGVEDAFYRYEGEYLVEERHDADNDGNADLVILYQNLRPVRAEEDQDRDGRIDTWTAYRTVEGEAVVVRIERDSKGRGQPDVFETFEMHLGEPVLARREEDLDGDGQIDITSIFDKGKLVQRELADPDLAPL